MRSKKLMKKGGAPIGNILYQHEITIVNQAELFTTIKGKLEESAEEDSSSQNVKKIIDFLSELNDPSKTPQNENYIDGETIFANIGTIVKEYKPKSRNLPGMDFQTAKFSHRDHPSEIDKNQTLFGLYQLYNKESKQKYITIDPTIIQIMIFDNHEDGKNDIVYSLKLIIREKKHLTLRYTTQLFPIKNKTIAEHGNHEYLMNKKGYYYLLKQFEFSN